MITTAAAIMVVVFSSFVLDDDPTVKMLAVGMAVAVLIDATVVRMALVPSVLALLEARAWYLPRWLDRVLPELRIEEGPENEPTPAAATEEAAPQPGPVLPEPRGVGPDEQQPPARSARAAGRAADRHDTSPKEEGR